MPLQVPLKIERIFQMPNTNTFEIKRVKEFIRSWMKPEMKVLDVFAGTTRFNGSNVIYVDSNPDVEPTIVADVIDIDKTDAWKERYYDLILFDPPYSWYQAILSYKEHGTDLYKKKQKVTIIRDKLDKLIKIGGIAISFGWNSTGFSKRRGYEKLHLLMVNHGGSHNDTLCLVERKVT